MDHTLAFSGKWQDCTLTAYSTTATPGYAKVRPVRGKRCEYCGRLALDQTETCAGCGAPRTE